MPISPRSLHIHARNVADLLTAEVALEPTFMELVQKYLIHHGYRMVAEQRGIEGTRLRVVKEPTP